MSKRGSYGHANEVSCRARRYQSSQVESKEAFEGEGYNLARKFHANFVATNTRQSKRNARHGEKFIIDAKKETIF